MSSKRPVVRAASAAGLVLAAAALGACAGPRMQRVDPTADDAVGGTGIDSADVLEIGGRAAESLSETLLQSPRNDFVIAFPTIKNETAQPFNTAALSDRIRDRVFERTAPRVKFLAREHSDEVLREREGKRSGVYSGAERKQMAGANFLLTGRITAIHKRFEGDRADWFQFSLVLVDAEDGTMVFSRTYDFKKVGDAGAIYQ